MNKSPLIKPILALVACGSVGSALASTDYGPAIWKPIANNYYTTGYGHKFLVIHDMEGYYASVYNVLVNAGVSVHFAVNGKQDAASDAPAGEVSQFVRTAYYAWDARCWNQHHIGTEHEGFASNPAWYTDAEYGASASLQKFLCNTFGIAKDRNHVVGHGEKSNSAWVSWANANLGIDATCNTHTDPGPYWNWNYLMNLINDVGNNASPVGSSYPNPVTHGQSFSASITMNNNGTTPWVGSNAYRLGSQNPQDNTRWGLGRVTVSGTVSHDQNATFNFNCTAPTTAGTYPFDWKMVQDGVQWFGTTSTGSIVVN